MLRWLEHRGCRVILLIAPLPDGPVSDAQVVRLAEEFSGVAVCDSDGLIAASDSLAPLLDSLDGTPLRSFSEALGEKKKTGGREGDLLQVDRTFCHDALIGVLQQLRTCTEGRCVLLAEYVFMTRVLPLFGGETFKIVDTIDVFSTKQKKVVQYGVDDSLAMTSAQERCRLLRSDLVIAIQAAEREELVAIVPERPVITVGVDFDVLQHNPASPGHVIFYVASDNAMNVKGVLDFLRFAWPWIQREVPDATLKIAGKVCQSVLDVPPGVELLGPVNDVAPLYREARLAINPAIAGTGLKIKTVEALCHLRPIVSWPSGVDGMDPELANLCLPVTDWRQFSRRVIDVLTDPRVDWFSPAQQETIRRHLSPDYVYAPLEERLEGFLGKALPSPRHSHES